MKIYEEITDKNEFLTYVKENMFDEAYNFARWLDKKNVLDDFMVGYEYIDIYSMQDYLIYYQDEIVDLYNIVDDYEKDYLNFR